MQWCVLFFSFLSTLILALDIQIASPYAVLMDAETGKVLYEKNGRARIFPASTMKIATLLYILENYPDRFEESALVYDDALHRTTEAEKYRTNFAAPPYFLEPDGTMIYLRRKERIPMKSLFFAALFRSANDACNVMAHHVAGDIPNFVEQMNLWLQGMGAEATHFVNPHGLHHPEHYSCAYDMALIMRAAYHNPRFLELALERSHEKERTNLQKRELWSTNCSLLNQKDELYYPKTLFAKTGQLRVAKYNLVAVATNGERTLVAAIHKSPNRKQRYLDAIHMFEVAFNEVKEKRLLFRREETRFERTIPRGSAPIIARPKEDIYLEYFPSEEPEIDVQLEWQEGLQLPLGAEEQVGSLLVRSKHHQSLLLEVPLFNQHRVTKRWSLWVWGLLGLIIGGSVVGGGIYFLRRRVI